VIGYTASAIAFGAGVPLLTIAGCLVVERVAERLEQHASRRDRRRDVSRVDADATSMRPVR
jgi:hypothetical protein